MFEHSFNEMFYIGGKKKGNQYLYGLKSNVGEAQGRPRRSVWENEQRVQKGTTGQGNGHGVYNK